MIVLNGDKFELKATNHKGVGVFARGMIQEGKVVADYVGKIYDLNDDLPKYPGLYDMWVYKDLTICPDIGKPGAHLINHSCEPNCAMYPFQGHILIVTLRKIFKGEELTYHYWCSGDSEYLACECGANKCRGTWLVSDWECKVYCDWVEEENRKYLRQLKLGKLVRPLDNYDRIKIDTKKTVWDLLI